MSTNPARLAAAYSLLADALRGLASARAAASPDEAAARAAVDAAYREAIATDPDPHNRGELSADLALLSACPASDLLRDAEDYAGVARLLSRPLPSFCRARLDVELPRSLATLPARILRRISADIASLEAVS